MGSRFALLASDRSRNYAIVRLVCYAAAVLPFAMTWGGAFPLDDAYITLHNARVLLTGSDPYYGTSPLTGATSGVHLALVAALGLAMPLPLALITLCAAAALAYLWGLDVLVRQMGVTGWKVPLLVSIGATAGTIPHLLMNGLETGLAMAVAVWMLVLADHRRLALLAGMATYVRPELGVLAALLMLRQVRMQPWREGARRSLIAIAAAAPWALWYFVELGMPFPNTMAAKVAFFRQENLPAAFLITLLSVAMIKLNFVWLVFGLLGIQRARAGWECLAFVVMFLCVLLAALPVAASANAGRYLSLVVPSLLVGLVPLARSLPGSAILLLIAAMETSTLQANWQGLQTIRSVYREKEKETRTDLAQLPEGAVVMLHDAGLPAWVQPHVKLVDAVGLKTPFSAMAHRRNTREVCKWGKALDAIGKHYQTRYAYVLRAEFWECTVTNLSGLGWNVRQMPSDATSHFRLYKIQPPDVSRSGNVAD